MNYLMEICSMGLSENPCEYNLCLNGLAVGHFSAYRCAYGHTRGYHGDGFCFRILKSIKEFEDVFGRPTNNGSTVVNEHRSLKQVGLGLQKCLDVGRGLQPRHDFFSGVL